MEDLVIDAGFWTGRRVFLTGHTGFKGSWMSLVLTQLGAKVFGYALSPNDRRDLFVTACVEREVEHRIGDVRQSEALARAIEDAQPSIVIHMAAQALVRLSYEKPVETYSTNVLGTVNLLEATRACGSIEAAIIVTSDKCYENREWLRGYRETDRLGGRDPYSNSKSCAELVTAAYRSSFFNRERSPGIASARAGNVIGGGDWSTDRLVPDAMKAFISREVLSVRNPQAIRPWQHVLDPILAYLLLAERLVHDPVRYSEAWNFGPSHESEVSVEVVADRLVRHWGNSSRWQKAQGDHPHEATYLKLDCSKAQTQLGWKPLLDLDQSLRLTVDWYRTYQDEGDIRGKTIDQIAQALNHPKIASPAHP